MKTVTANWSYETYVFSNHNPTELGTELNRLATLNRELVAVDGDRYFFKLAGRVVYEDSKTLRVVERLPEYVEIG